jgi:hypothetical protein
VSRPGNERATERLLIQYNSLGMRQLQRPRIQESHVFPIDSFGHSWPIAPTTNVSLAAFSVATPIRLASYVLALPAAVRLQPSTRPPTPRHYQRRQAANLCGRIFFHLYDYLFTYVIAHIRPGEQAAQTVLLLSAQITTSTPSLACQRRSRSQASAYHRRR